MREVFGKRGVSAVIAVVLLILIVIGLTSFLFSWGVSFFNSQTGDSHAQYSAGKVCDSLDILVTLIGRSEVLPVTTDFEFEAVNRGSFNITSLKFKLVSAGDSSFVTSSLTNIPAGSAKTGNFSNTTSFDLGELVAYAVLDKDLVGAREDVVCENKKILVDASRV